MIKKFKKKYEMKINFISKVPWFSNEVSYYYSNSIRTRSIFSYFRKHNLPIIEKTIKN